jgi:hypothetical protein
MTPQASSKTDHTTSHVFMGPSSPENPSSIPTSASNTLHARLFARNHPHDRSTLSHEKPCRLVCYAGRCGAGERLASRQAQRKKTDPGPANRSPDPDRVGNDVLGRPFQAACRLCWYQCAARRIPASKPTPGSRRRSDRSGCVEDVISRQHVECGRRSAVLRKDRPRACPTVSSSSGQGVAVTLADGAQHGVRRDGRRVSGVMDGRRGRLPRGAPPPWGRRPRRR